METFYAKCASMCLTTSLRSIRKSRRRRGRSDELKRKSKRRKALQKRKKRRVVATLSLKSSLTVVHKRRKR